MVKRILHIQAKLFIPSSIDNEKELQGRTDEDLLRYFKMHERLFLEEKNNISYNINTPCDKCGKYMGKLEINLGNRCFECLEK